MNLGKRAPVKTQGKVSLFFQVCISDCNGFQILCAQDYNISISKVDTEYATFIQNAMLSSKKEAIYINELAGIGLADQYVT